MCFINEVICSRHFKNESEREEGKGNHKRGKRKMGGLLVGASWCPPWPQQAEKTHGLGQPTAHCCRWNRRVASGSQNILGALKQLQCSLCGHLWVKKQELKLSVVNPECPEVRSRHPSIWTSQRRMQVDDWHSGEWLLPVLLMVAWRGTPAYPYDSLCLRMWSSYYRL